MKNTMERRSGNTLIAYHSAPQISVWQNFVQIANTPKLALYKSLHICINFKLPVS